jgi:hypothetical protein
MHGLNGIFNISRIAWLSQENEMLLPFLFATDNIWTYEELFPNYAPSTWL